MSVTKRILAVVWIFQLPFITLPAQERLISISSYRINPSTETGKRLKTNFTDTLELPFMDDFSTTMPYPDSFLWSDRLAYINNDFGYQSPTFGVATLDMMDSDGMIYDFAETEPFRADYLTSRPLNLFYPQDTTVYLSFYWQPQGLGDAPEPDDSLILEFYAPDSKQWIHVWSIPGTPLSDFHLQMIPITDSRFLQKGFRFRFSNRASLAPSFEPSLKVNADHWHLDYIYLNRNRNYRDTIMNEVSLTDSPGSLLLTYTAMPWQHFREVGINGVKTIFPIHLRNLSVQRYFFQPTFQIEDLSGTTEGFGQRLDADEIKAFETLNYDGTFNYGFTSDAPDSALFKITLNLNLTEPDWLPYNDSLSVYQVFTNYYAYDDGTPEAGYGLTGEGTKNGRVALRFQNYQPGDSLIAIRYFFNRSFEDANRKYFIAAIWSDFEGQPGDLIYAQQGAVSDNKLGLNEFLTIKLDTARKVPAVYYIGWIQTTSDFLNAGFDRNHNQKDKLFFSIGNTWQSSNFDGCVMIRPVFANKSKKSGINNLALKPEDLLQVKIYPNPVRDKIHFRFDDKTASATLTVINQQGSIIYQKERIPREVSVHTWTPGIYFIHIRSHTGASQFSRMIVLHE